MLWVDISWQEIEMERRFDSLDSLERKRLRLERVGIFKGDLFLQRIIIEERFTSGIG